jgi:hypothetical protein
VDLIGPAGGVGEALGLAQELRLQVSIWAGEKKQRTRPPWAPSCLAWKSTARRSPCRPCSSFHSHSTRLPSRVSQRPDRKA